MTRAEDFSKRTDISSVPTAQYYTRVFKRIEPQLSNFERNLNITKEKI